MPDQKHTPGPWFVFGNGHCVGGPVEPGNGLCDNPEQKTAGVAMCGMRLRTAEENAANAELIAQAPSLLAERDLLRAACLAMLERLDEYDPNDIDFGRSFFRWPELAAIRAAVKPAS